MVDYKRTSVRHNVIHLNLITVYINSKFFPVIDLSHGGFSASVDVTGSHKFNAKTIFRKVKFKIGYYSLVVDCEAMFFDKVDSICSFKIIKYHQGTKRQLGKFLKNIEVANKFTKMSSDGDCIVDNSTISLDQNEWRIETSDFKLESSNGKVQILKKSLFSNRKKVLFLALGYIAGLPRDIWPVVKMSADIVNSYND